jgi:NTP pyrophosphatase (non-canonical NTP hydrolase)
MKMEKENDREPTLEQLTRQAKIMHNQELIYASAVDKWGNKNQLDMLVEECAELISAVNKLRRGRIGMPEFFDEISDVEIMLGQMRCIFDTNKIDEVKRKKLIRLAERTGRHFDSLYAFFKENY